MTLSNLMQFQSIRPSKNCKNRKKQSVISEGLYLTLCLFIKPEVAAKTRTMAATQLCVVMSLWPGSGLFLPSLRLISSYLPHCQNMPVAPAFFSHVPCPFPRWGHTSYNLCQNQGHLMLRDAMSLWFTTATCPVQSDGCPQPTNISQIQKKSMPVAPLQYFSHAL